MRKYATLSAVLIFIVVVCVVLLGLASVQTLPQKSANTVTLQPVSQATKPAAVTSPASTTQSNTVSASPTLAPTAPIPGLNLTIITADVPVGSPIQESFVQANNNLHLIKGSALPSLSIADAIKVLSDNGLAWATSNQYNGHPVVIRAVYGLASLGQSGDTSGYSLPDGSKLTKACAGWIGSCNMLLAKCVNGICTNSVTIAGPYKSRPAWVLDFKLYASLEGGGGALGGSPHSNPDKNHFVYLMDATKKVVVEGWPCEE